MKVDVLDSLYSSRDTAYRDFQSKLIPSVSADSIIGVRTPKLRKLARDMKNDCTEFLSNLPHKYFEENQLHSFIISGINDFHTAIAAVDAFLPYVDNWATCDQMSPRAFAKNTEDLLPYIKKWIASKHCYTVRFAVLCLMRYFLDEKFNTKYLDMVMKISSQEYYVNMMRAWYFATALAKQYDAVLPYFADGKIDTWTHNRAIQKAIESYRISPKNKLELKSLKTKVSKWAL